jgi:hypothetical protein
MSYFMHRARLTPVFLIVSDPIYVSFMFMPFMLDPIYALHLCFVAFMLR